MLYCAQESNRWSVGPWSIVREYKWRGLCDARGWASGTWDISRRKNALAALWVVFSQATQNSKWQTPRRPQARVDVDARVGRAAASGVAAMVKSLKTRRNAARRAERSAPSVHLGLTYAAGASQPLEDVQQKETEMKLELQKDDKELKKGQKCKKAVAIAFSVITALTALLAVTLIAVSTMSAVTASAMDAQDDSGRLVALVVLAVTAAVTIAMVIYAQIATCTSKIRPIFVATIVLTILAVIQGIIAGASVRVTPKDADHIQQSLKDSFDMAARQHNPRHIKIWATTQATFHCCGFTSPYDYVRNALQIPDVPISCCPTYDQDRSDLLQEKERFMCKDRREYFETGCSGDVLLVITETAQWVFHVSVGLIIFELLSAVVGAILVRRRKAAEANDKENNDDKDAK